MLKNELLLLGKHLFHTYIFQVLLVQVNTKYLVIPTS